MQISKRQIGHGLAKILGIQPDYRDPTAERNAVDSVTRGESVFSGTIDSYIEEEPHTLDWIQEFVPSWNGVYHYFYDLFPFLRWITRYNLQWFLGDLIAGVTVGAVVVPQGMAYAKLAELPPQYGLYSSFMGVLIYWFFATSKDITIGPVAVMSTLVGDIVNKIHQDNPHISAQYIAGSLSIISGAIVLFIGLIRCGWIVDFIPLPAISAFMTGSALNIAVGQVPKLMGITGFSSRDSTYKVVINILKHLGRTKLDAAMGLTALAMLYIIRFCCQWGARRYPAKAKVFFFAATLRTVFVILLYIAISAGVNIHRKDHPAFAVLGHIPRGFQNVGAPQITTEIIKKFAGDLPVSVIILLIEHIAISKSFGRVNNYAINPSQELVAIGVSNLLGPLLGGYPVTGSFSRTAVKSKAGVRTPFAGVITAILVLISIYALPAMFFYIPSASLSGVIIHAVGDLITSPNTLYQFWRVNPLEVVIFFVGVFVTIFSSIENGIYCTICISAAVLLFRIVKARGQFLGRVRVHSLQGDQVDHDNGVFRESTDNYRNIFLPINHYDGSNPHIQVQQPRPGIFIYQFSEGFNYPNAGHLLDGLVQTVFSLTRRTKLNSYSRLGDRPWNDPGPRRGHQEPDRSGLPTLKAIILDFVSVNNIDVTSIQNLIDVRNQLDRYADPQPVNWHFANVNNRWTKRALASAGFGYVTPPPENYGGLTPWKPIFSVAEVCCSDHAATQHHQGNGAASRNRHSSDIEEVAGATASNLSGNAIQENVNEADDGGGEENFKKQLAEATMRNLGASRPRVALVSGLNRPLFHPDLTSALESAVMNAAPEIPVGKDEQVVQVQFVNDGEGVLEDNREREGQDVQ